MLDDDIIIISDRKTKSQPKPKTKEKII